MSRSQIGICPNCAFESLYTGSAKRPRMTCPKCKKRYYIVSKESHKIIRSTPQEPKDIDVEPLPTINRINAETVEAILLNRLNKNRGEADTPLIRCVIDYVIKIKTLEDDDEGDTLNKALIIKGAGPFEQS